LEWGVGVGMGDTAGVGDTVAICSFNIYINKIIIRKDPYS